MLKFEEYLVELFNTTIPYSKQDMSSNEIDYSFTTPKGLYVNTIFEFHKTALYPDWEIPFVPGWYLEFSCNGEFDITGGGEAIPIFSTVIAIFKDFLKNPKVSKVYFTATTYEQSRVDLYTKMVKVLSKDSNVEYTIENEIPRRPGLYVFVITKK